MPTTTQPKRNFAGNVQVEGNNAGQSDIATLGEFGCQASPGLDTTASATTMGESRTLANNKKNGLKIQTAAVEKAPYYMYSTEAAQHSHNLHTHIHMHISAPTRLGVICHAIARPSI